MERADFEQWTAKEVARLLALVETERRYYQEIVAAIPVPLVVLSARMEVAWANRAFRRTFGLRAEELRGKDIERVLPVAGLGDWIREVHARGTGVPPLPVQVGLDAFRVTGVPVRTWDDEADVEMLLVFEQAAAPGTAAAPPPASAGRMPAMSGDVPAIVWQAEPGTLAFRSVGGAAEEILGYPVKHWTGRAGFFEERIHPDDRAATMALYRPVLASGGDASAEFRAVSASGESVWCRESLRAGRGTVTGVITPIGLRKQLEQQLLAAERIEALQWFAGRLAHDLNNPLMIAAGYTEDAHNALPEDSPLRGDLAEVLKATARMSELAGRLNELARRHAGAAAPVNLNELLPASEPRIARAAGEGVKIEMNRPSGPVWASANAAQLEEVIETLASRDRAGAEERTRLRVSWDAAVIRERTTPATLAPGRYARIVLEGDGRGIEAARQAAVFDPAVSPGKAEGLAMARAYSVVREWGGDIAVSGEPGRGSAFTVYLPYAGQEPSAPPGPPKPATRRESPGTAARETILVVDDEAGIRSLIRKILRRERYVVVEAGSAEEALEAAAAYGKPFDLLLTDVMLPGMQGPDLASRMYAAQPSLKVLYISGYTPDERVRGGEYPPGARFLAKPFTLEALLSKIRETLDA